MSWVQDSNVEPIGKIRKKGVGRVYTIMTLENFGDVENWLGSLVDGQLDGFDCGLSEKMEALDVGGRHLRNQGIGGRMVCMCLNKQTFLRSRILRFSLPSNKTLCRFQS